jgi:hypothetical protein
MANKFSSNLRNNLSLVDQDMGIRMDSLKGELEHLKENEFGELDETEKRLCK